MNKSNSTRLKIPLLQKVILIIFGIFLFLALLETGLRLGGFVLSSLQEYRNRVSIQQKDAYRIMCLGESTTVDGKYSYPNQLEEILNQRNLGIKFSVINKGVIGTNSTCILSQLEGNLNKYLPDMVIAMMGINDGKNFVHYEGIHVPRIILFIRSLRTYKWAKHILRNIVAKAEELGISSPNNDEEYIELGWFKLKQNKLFQAEGMFKKAIELNPNCDYAYGALAVTYSKMGKYDLAEQYYKKANSLKLNYYNPKTLHNYHRLKEILDKRKITFVCVQYPMRSIEPLKKIFDGQEEGIIFVDNEKVFKEALKRASYDEYFADMFAGDFGHCTAKGNRLLAENIAKVILKECFKK